MDQYLILPKLNRQAAVSQEVLKKAAVIAHLYYEEQFKRGFWYLLHVPEEMDVYIITANPAVERLAEQAIKDHGRKHFHVLTKPNRGRDFAALLITARELLPRYSYVAFVHDKQNSTDDRSLLYDIWESCMYEAILGSRDYIRGILTQFEKDPELGLLSAPVPAVASFIGLAGLLWTGNYEATVRLLERIGVKKLPSAEEDPMTIGSAFWFRTQALQKLLSYPLDYEDFPEEPMPGDHTLAHLLERSLKPIAEDAGYRALFVLNSEYAQGYLAARCDQLTKAMCVIREAAETGRAPDFMAALEQIARLETSEERLKEAQRETENGGSAPGQPVREGS